jgi:hypothetical protein
MGVDRAVRDGWTRLVVELVREDNGAAANETIGNVEPGSVAI